MGKMSKSLRFEVLTRDGYRCRYCGADAKSVSLHIDHVLPRSVGGKDELGNLVTACADCNHGKSDRQIVGIPPGFALTADKRPARMAKMRAAIAVSESAEHVLNCDNIEEWDELNDDSQLVWVWCETHKKYEWHSVHLDYAQGGGILRTAKKPVVW